MRFLFAVTLLLCADVYGEAASSFAMTVMAGPMLPSLTLSLDDGVGAASGGAGCVNVTTPSVFSSAAGQNGMSALGTFNMTFSTGAPTGAQGCVSQTSTYAIQTFSMSTTTERAARLDVTLTAGSTWSSVKFGAGDANDWTNDSTGTAVTTTSQTVLPSIGIGTVTQPIQLAWRVAIGAPSGAKSGSVQLTLFMP